MPARAPTAASGPTARRPPGEGPGSRRVPLAALAAVAAVLGVALVNIALTRTGRGQLWDATPLLGRGDRDPAIAVARERYDDLSLLLTAALALALAVLVVRRATPAVAGVLLAAAAGATLGTQVLKAVLDRPRIVVGPDLAGFPSGHTAVATALALAVLALAPPAWRAPAALAAGGAAGFAGVAVVGAGWHRPSDALGAHLLCLAWSAAGVALLARAGRVRPVTPGATHPLAWAGRVLLAVLIPLAVALAAARALDPAAGVVADPAGAADDLRLQALAVGASGMGVALATAALLRGADLGRARGA